MSKNHNIQLINNTHADLTDRINALSGLLAPSDGSEKHGCLAFILCLFKLRNCKPLDTQAKQKVLINQLKTEVSRKDDTQFVLYLYDALGKIYDRGSVHTHLDLLKMKDIDGTFRMVSVSALSQLYYRTLFDLDGAIHKLKDPNVDMQDPLLQRFMQKQFDYRSYFEINGNQLNDHDLSAIEAGIKAVADDNDEIDLVRDSAKEALDMINDIKT